MHATQVEPPRTGQPHSQGFVPRDLSHVTPHSGNAGNAQQPPCFLSDCLRGRNSLFAISVLIQARQKLTYGQKADLHRITPVRRKPGVGRSTGDDAMALSDYFLHHQDVVPISPSGRAKQRPRPGLLRRLADALVASQLQRTEHEIARYLESTGGKFTDSIEREMEERLYPHNRDRLF
jgi:hypothetical protein